MFRNSAFFKRSSSKRKRAVARWCVFCLRLALAFYTGGVGQTTFVRAAPRANETIDSFEISTSPIPSPACAHSLYEVQFFARVDRVADLNGNKVDLKGGLGPSDISVKATSSDTNVAEFHPEILTASALDNRIGRGADFKLKTEAPGSATLTLTGKLEWTGERVIFPPLQLPVKVVNCRFRITINTILLGIGPAITETVVSTVTGEINGEANGALTGQADVIWKAQQATPCLSVVQTAPPSKATLEGSLSEDGSSLTVHVTYDPAMAFSTGTSACYVKATRNWQSQFQAPPLSFTVPTTGGSLSQPVSLHIGESAKGLTGTAIIGVQPIEDK